MKHLVLIALIVLFFSCDETHQDRHFDAQSLSRAAIPERIPLAFGDNLAGEGELIHRGIFSPDFKHFYFTISSKDFSHFTIKSMTLVDGQWSEPTNAFFNSAADDHGMSFSPSGDELYFSSTRQVDQDSIELTWHLWKTTQLDGEWSEPVFIDIPNLRQKLVSHPTVTQSGRLYFHASDLDYSNMHLYYADQVEGEFGDAKLVFPEQVDLSNTCTPFIAPDESYLIYARIEEQLQLMICRKNSNGNWGVSIPLNDLINTNGQGNPFVTADHAFLFFATGSDKLNDWQLKWVSMDGVERE